jgi:hypothetical protein
MQRFGRYVPSRRWLRRRNAVPWPLNERLTYLSRRTPEMTVRYSFALLHRRADFATQPAMHYFLADVVKEHDDFSCRDKR